MAERRPVFSTKDHRAQFGYVEADEAFDLSGRLRCTYNAATGNLHDTITGKIVGHVSLAGNFVGSSWMAHDLFGTSSNPTIVPNVSNIREISDLGAPGQETEPVAMAETSENPEDAPNVPNIRKSQTQARNEKPNPLPWLRRVKIQKMLPTFPTSRKYQIQVRPQKTEPVVMAEKSDNPEDVLDRAIEMVRSALKEKPPPR